MLAAAFASHSVINPTTANFLRSKIGPMPCTMAGLTEDYLQNPCHHTPDAYRDLECQLDQAAGRQPCCLAVGPQPRRGLPAGDQVRRRSLSARAVRGARL